MNKKHESGAVSEEDFEIAFEQTPTIEVTSLRELKESMTSICDRLQSDDWQHRVDNLRQIRGVFKGNNLTTDDYLQYLRYMDLKLKSCVADLRSQVVREACITVAYLSKEIKNKLDTFIEQLLDDLLNLVPNGAKIMSSSGKIALKIIVSNTQSVRILSFFLTSVTTSKSTSVRQFCSEIVKLICEKWPTKSLDKSANSISETLKKGLSDADEQARANSREAFCWFHMKFPQFADKLLQSLDTNKQKTLQRELSAFGRDNLIDVVDAGPKLFKVPASRPAKVAVPVASSVISSTPRSTNNTPRSRINSAKSENQSVKPKVPTSKTDVTDGRSRQSKISQSQPATREPSPSYKSSYVTYTNGGTQDSANSNSFSKRASPNAYSSLRYKEMESEVMDRLKRTRKMSQQDHYQSDDNASETSSVVSDQLPSFNELMVLLNSKTWSDRKRGLSKTEKYIIECHIKPTERKSLIDIFNAMFLENQTVVVKKFLLVLYLFIDKYHDHLNDWLYQLIGKLLNIHSNDRLKSCKPDVHKLLILTIDHFGPPVVFMHCCKYLIDKTQELTIKLKISLLEYMKCILTVAQPSLLDSTNSDIGPSLGNIIVLTAETKSTELRKLSSNLVIKLFDLNSAQFSRLLKTLPNTFQDRATSILDTYITHHATKDDTTSSDVGDFRTPKPKLVLDKTSDFIKINTEALQNMSLNCDNFDKHSVVSNSSNRSVTSPNNYGTYQKGGNYNPFYQNKQGHIPVLKPSHNNYSPGNSQLYDSSNMQRYLSSQNSHPDLSIDNANSNHSPSLYPATSNDSNVDSKYNPEYYSSGPIDTSLLSKGDAPPSNTELAPEDVMSEILKELSNHNERHEERRACLFKLIKMFRENTPTDWDEHFKTLLFLLLETMGDSDAEIRAQALRVLQELAKSQGPRFHEYTQLTILRVLEANKDPDKSVVKAAEECSRVLTTTMPRQLCLKMLIDIISDGNENQLCLAALKMLIKLAKTTDRKSIESDLESLCEALSLVVNHKESQVRKESILCLVEIHKMIGDEVWTRIKLTNSQIRLLEVYIKKNNN